MNKSEVVAKLSEKTGHTPKACGAVVAALEQVSGSVLASRIKGVKLDESSAVEEIAQKAQISAEDCKAILSALEETFGDALGDKFRIFKK